MKFTGRQDFSATVQWMRAGTAALMATVAKLADTDFAEPSMLPGWSRAHLIGHLARNAEALTRLATWARTGHETPMYTSSDQRGQEIESSARYPVSKLRAELASTASDLDVALAGLRHAEWQAMVRSALGRSIPAAEIPWMRCREVWLHAVDLGSGGSTTDFPPELVDILIDDVTDTLSKKGGCPCATLTATNRGLTWRLGPGDAEHDVSGAAAELAAWLTGRSSGASLSAQPYGLPRVPNWL